MEEIPKYVDEFKTEWASFKQEFQKFENDMKEYDTKQEDLVKKQDSAISNTKKQLRALSRLREIKTLYLNSVNKFSEKEFITLEKDVPEELTGHNLLEQYETKLKEYRRKLPESGSNFLAYFLGTVNVRLPTLAARLNYKEEYENHKRECSHLSIIFNLILLLLLYTNHLYRWMEALYQVYLLYYYITMTVRENILKVNGSNIKPWWIYHHYFTIVLVFMIVTWDGPGYECFRTQYLIFFFIYCTSTIITI